VSAERQETQLSLGRACIIQNTGTEYVQRTYAILTKYWMYKSDYQSAIVTIALSCTIFEIFDI